MTNEDFEILVNKAMDRSHKLLFTKGQEYTTTDNDRLGQFQRVAVLQNTNPAEALMGMLSKHLTSVADMVKDPTSYNFEKWYEKLDDIRNYTFLLEGVVKDIATNKCKDNIEEQLTTPNVVKALRSHENG